MSQPDYEIITVNTLPGKPRRRTFQGRDYLVVDATLLREGVLNGSRGPLYYPPEEIAANPGIWNHVPIVVWHPKDSQGHPTLARQPEILEEYGIGLLFNDRYEGKKRVAEAWFDEKRTTAFDARLDNQHKILPRINNGRSVELSTGLHTKNFPAPAESVFNADDGVSYPYSAVARNYLPDHLAALPDQKGACSVTYGCGFNVNNDINDLDNTPDDDPELLENAAKGGCRWVTTDAGNHLCIRGNKIVAGNPHVIKAAGGSGGSGKSNDGNKGGGGSDSGKGGSGGGNKVASDGDGERSHSVKLPSSKSKLKIEQAHTALTEMGYELGKGSFDLKTQSTFYELTHPDGKKVRVSSDEVKEIVFRGYKKKKTNNEDSTTDNANQPRSANTGQFKAYGSGYGKDPWQSEAQRGAMSLTDDDIADGTSASAEVGEKGHNPISWVADEKTWEKAKSAAREGGYQEGSDQYWAVVAHIYKQMGGKKKPTSNSEDTEMPKADDIKYLTANCDCWKGKDTVLANMTDAEVASWRKFYDKAKKDEHVANAVVSSGFTVNSENKIQAVENAGECPKCGGKMKDGKCQSCGYTEKATMNTLNLDDPKVLDAVTGKLFGLTANESKAVMNSAKKVEQRERWNLVHTLTANIEDEVIRKERVGQLLKEPMDRLELIASLMPKQAPITNAQQDETTLFMQAFYGKGSRDGSQGASSEFVGNRGQYQDDKPDVDGGPRIMPTLNYDECSEVGKKIRQKTA